VLLDETQTTIMKLSDKVDELLRAMRTPAIAAMSAVFLINVVSYADRTILTVLQESIKADLKLSDFQLGLLAGPVFAIFYGFMGLPIARLAERKSRKRIIITGLYLWSLFTAMCGAAQNFVQLALFRMGVGAAEAAAPPAMHSLIADYFTRAQRGRAMAVLALGIPLGLMVGGIVGGFVASATNWRVAFAAIGLPGILIGLYAMKVMYEAKRTSDHGKVSETPLNIRDSLRSLWAIPTYRFLLLAAVLSGNASHAISTFSASYFIRAHGLTLAAVGGILLTGKGLAGMLGTVTSGYISDKLDRGNNQDYLLVPGVASLLASGILWMSFDVGGEVLALGLFFLAAFFSNMIMSPAFAAVQNVVDPRTRATAAALFLFCITVPGSGGPVAVGFVSDRVASSSLGLDVATYLASCPGGRAAEGVIASIATQCGTAATTGLRSGMLVGISLYVVSFFVYLLAVRAGRKSATALPIAAPAEDAAH
jgi:predicted MFS family arabinose efflux permease